MDANVVAVAVAIVLWSSILAFVTARVMIGLHANGGRIASGFKMFVAAALYVLLVLLYVVTPFAHLFIYAIVHAVVVGRIEFDANEASLVWAGVAPSVGVIVAVFTGRFLRTRESSEVSVAGVLKS